MKEKVQVPIVQVQEYNFAEAHESSSSDRYTSRNDLYTRYGHVKMFSLEKTLNIFPKVRDISYKEISLVTVKDHVKNTLNLVVATQDRVSKNEI